MSRALVSLVMLDSPNPASGRRGWKAPPPWATPPKHLASRLASHRTNTVGIVFLDLHNRVFAYVYDGISEGLAGSGNQVMVAVGSADPGTELEAVRNFVNLRVDGVLLAGYTGSPEELEAALRGTLGVVITR